MGLPIVEVPKYTLKLPSTGEELQYRPFLVKEEKILLIAMEGDNQKDILNATKDVIKNCVFGEYDIEKLAIFDIEYIFLWLRGKSKGEEIELKYTCPQCSLPLEVKFNIEEIEIKRSEKHNKKIELSDKLGVVMKYPNADIQAIIDDGEADKHQIELVFKNILYCIDYIYDEEKIYAKKDHSEKELNDFLESLTDEQFQKISNFFETMPKLSHTINLHCIHPKKVEIKNKKTKPKTEICGYKEEIVLEGLQSFFE